MSLHNRPGVPRWRPPQPCLAGRSQVHWYKYSQLNGTGQTVYIRVRRTFGIGFCKPDGSNFSHLGRRLFLANTCCGGISRETIASRSDAEENSGRDEINWWRETAANTDFGKRLCLSREWLAFIALVHEYSRAPVTGIPRLHSRPRVGRPSWGVYYDCLMCHLGSKRCLTVCKILLQRKTIEFVMVKTVLEICRRRMIVARLTIQHRALQRAGPRDLNYEIFWREINTVLIKTWTIVRHFNNGYTKGRV